MCNDANSNPPICSLSFPIIGRVLMLGGPGVGKSSLCSQFLSSDHINTYMSVGKRSLCDKVSVAIHPVLKGLGHEIEFKCMDKK